MPSAVWWAHAVRDLRALRADDLQRRALVEHRRVPAVREQAAGLRPRDGDRRGSARRAAAALGDPLPSAAAVAARQPLRRVGMPSVICPSCERVTFAAAAYRALDLCRNCGEALPLRRSVIPVTAQPALPSGTGDRPGRRDRPDLLRRDG
jgi:hypothetical protein